MDWGLVGGALLLAILPVVYWRKDASLNVGRPSLSLAVAIYFAPWWYAIWYMTTYRKARAALDMMAARP